MTYFRIGFLRILRPYTSKQQYHIPDKIAKYFIAAQMFQVINSWTYRLTNISLCILEPKLCPMSQLNDLEYIV